jgi:hypothetical protein
MYYSKELSMKAFSVFITMVVAAAIGLSVSGPVEAKRGHNKHDRYERHYDRHDRYEHGDRYARHGRSYIAARDIIYIRGIPYHRYNRIPVYVERNRYGHPVSYYVMQEYRDYERHDDYVQYDDYRYRDDRDGITIVYRNR